MAQKILKDDGKGNIRKTIVPTVVNIKKKGADGQVLKNTNFGSPEALADIAKVQSESDKARFGVQSFSSDPRIAQGQRVGLERAQNLYGIDTKNLGGEAASIREAYKKRLGGQDASTTNLRDSRNRQLRMARAGGASQEELAQISRGAESDINRTYDAQQAQRLNDYRRIVSNAIKGTQGSELGFAGLEKSGESVPVPRSGGISDTLFCGALFALGMMSDDARAADLEHANSIILHTPAVYYGYCLLAAPFVGYLYKSKTIARIVSVPVNAWIKHRSGDRTLLGKIVDKLGTKICEFTWRFYGKV